MSNSTEDIMKTSNVHTHI